MSRSDCEAFLAEPHVAVLAIEAEDGPPLAVPIWYLYEPGGDLVMHTGRRSRKARLLERAGRCTVTVQEAAMPYRYVSVESAVVELRPEPTREERLALAARYLGADLGVRYVEDTASTASDTVVVCVRPTRWRSVDYGRS